ncbi:hypothetical protein ARMGADRAFT_971717 [Armillaria gallica]|uniref:Fe2OG dioxygenase domain-containing protein n=1 Tax=Armillaria gallica TaxID=47427 RepID=A0A2H3D0T5_ARMGA|nr:hypothetical protein ARMGADRAFT_971717 [Armillaria gallica]
MSVFKVFSKSILRTRSIHLNNGLRTWKHLALRTMCTESKNPAVEAVRSALTENTFSCGQLKVAPDKLSLFYSQKKGGMEGAARVLNLANASEDSLHDLCQAADAAGFGLGNQNKFDEAYRKSKELDTSRFACNFDPRTTKIFDQVQADLIEGEDEIQKVLRPELYKLNIYSEGDFFKAHTDTPRAENMMGSLVVVFPTVHEGGSLLLRQDGQEWTFDAEKMLADSTPEVPAISYVVFYSDVEHEVLPVISGVRVTLTYNLYLEDKEPSVPAVIAKTSSNRIPTDMLKTALQNLLKDETFLPKGGLLGFGLRHKYAIIDESGIESQNSLRQLADRLKGSDASIVRVCRNLSLDTNIRILYKPRYSDGLWMTDQIIPDDAVNEEAEGMEYYLNEHGTLVSAPEHYAEDMLGEEEVELPDIVWVTPITTFNQTESYYIAYGNQAEVGYLYGDFCLIVKVGKPGSRDQGSVSEASIDASK